LSAIYIHVNSVLGLHKLIVGSSSHSALKNKFDRLGILHLRHAISAHPSNTKVDGKEFGYRVVRHSISDFNKIIIRNDNNDFFEYDLIKLINEYFLVTNKVMFEIIDASIRKIYKQDGSKIKEYTQKLADII
jgi:hypothetical protein